MRASFWSFHPLAKKPTMFCLWPIAFRLLPTAHGLLPIAYVLSVLEAVLYQKEESSSLLPLAPDVVEKMLERALQSAPKMIVLIKALALQFKFMSQTVTYHAGRAIGSPQQMQYYATMLKKGLDVEEFASLLQDPSGSIALLPLAMKHFIDLFETIVKQQVYGKFAEADANFTTLEKKLNCDALKDLIKTVALCWQDAHVQHKPKDTKKAEDEKDEEPGPPAVLMTREVAVDRASLAERDGYAKTYVLTGNEAVDRQNMYENYSICRVKHHEAATNQETQGKCRLHVFDGYGWVEVNAAFVKGQRPYYYKPGFEGTILEKSLSFFQWLEQPGIIAKAENLGLYMTWDIGLGLSSSDGAHGREVYNI